MYTDDPVCGSASAYGGPCWPRWPRSWGIMHRQINIGLIGLGTVGSGVVNILQRNADLIRRRLGVPIEIVKVAVRDPNRQRDVTLKPGVLTTNPKDVVTHPDI